MIAFLDLDEVIVNTYGSICKFKGFVNPYNDPKNLGKYSIHKLMNMNHQHFWDSITKDQWANMDKFEWSDNLVNTLNDLENQKLLTWRFLTSPIQNADCFAGKFEWIKKHYPNFTEKLIIGRDKQDIVGHDDLLIDDSPMNLKNFIKSGKLKSIYHFPSVGNVKFKEIPTNKEESQKLIQDIVITLIKKSSSN